MDKQDPELHIHPTLMYTRVSGLTYEPNWFAEQISFLIIPWLLASVLTGYSVFRWRWKRVTIEWFLLFWALVVLVFTFSRAGLMILITLIIVSIFLLNLSRAEAITFFHSSYLCGPAGLLASA